MNPSDQGVPRVAVVIPTYKQGQYLEAAVRSCFSQTYPVSEVWVVDDASPDETPAVMRRLCAEFPAIRYQRHAINLGMTANTEFAFRLPQTEFLVKLDSDDVLKRRYVEVLSSLLMRYPGAGYAHAAVEQIDGEGNVTALRRLFRTAGYESAENALVHCLRGAKYSANIQMFRVAALAAVRYLHDAPASGEDYDLSVKLADAGYGNVYSDEILAQYRVWGGTQWSDRRAILEIEGLVHTFNTKIVPAYQRRSWSLRPVQRYRRVRALGLSTLLVKSYLTPDQRQLITNDLLQLSSHPIVRLYVWLFNHGWGRLLLNVNKLGAVSRKRIKNLALRLRLQRLAGLTANVS